MFALMYLATAAAVIAIAVWVSVAVYRATHRRWLQVLAAVFMLWLPFWDVLPGLHFYHKAIREVGGVRIHRQVEAPGYLDLACQSPCRVAFWELVKSPYSFVEIKSEQAGPWADPLTPKPGYYEVRLFSQGSAECTNQSLPPEVTRRLLGDRDGVTGMCAIAKRHEEPVSLYRTESSNGWQRSDEYSWLRDVQVSWQRVVDNRTGEVIAQAASVSYRPWFFLLGLSPWVGTYRGSPPDPTRKFDVTRIILPTDRDK
jgi:hypothetical protein